MTLHEARTAARRARVRHDAFLDSLVAAGQSPTLEQRRRLGDLKDAELAAREALLDVKAGILRAHGIEVDAA